MRHVITFALVATAVCWVSALPGMPQECWELRPTVKPSDCCKGLNMLPEKALEECTKMYPDEYAAMSSTGRPTDMDDDDDSEDEPRPPHHGPHHHHHHGRHHCIVECYFNKTGVFKDRQVIKTTALKQFSENTQSTGTMQALLSSSIDTCIAEQAAMDKKFKEMIEKGDFPPHGRHPHPPPHHNDGKHCPPKAMHFTKCVEMNAYKSCPAEMKVSSAECSKLNEFMEKCLPKH